MALLQLNYSVATISLYLSYMSINDEVNFVLYSRMLALSKLSLCIFFVVNDIQNLGRMDKSR